MVCTAEANGEKKTAAFTVERKREIESALRDRGATMPCPRCFGESFTLLDGYLLEFQQVQLRNMVVGSNNRFASVASICDRCGFVAQHALDVLGV